jgi:predicted ATP-grasp superfamily ATP-dependent carboligase
MPSAGDGSVSAGAAGMHVLVSAGAEKQALAAVRSLGRAGARVDVVETKPDAPAFRSRWCDKAFVAPGLADRAAYAAFLLERVQARRYTTLLACDDVTATILSEERQRFLPYVPLLLPDADRFRTATDKAALVHFAAAAGIPVPRTLHPASTAEATEMAPELGFPLIVKGHHGWGAQHVRLVQRAADLGPHFEAVAALEAAAGGGLPMLQEFIAGSGYGFSTLFRHGAPRAWFMHRRAAEFDVTSGGTPYSCPVAESVREPELERLGLRLFAALDWHGLGMAEWRRETGTGRFVLMEINPRLVGSTDLAIHSGIDLPLLACRLVRDGDIDVVAQYPAGIRWRWLLPDGLRDLLAEPRRIFTADVWRAASDWSWRDPLPHWMQLRRTAWTLRHGR